MNQTLTLAQALIASDTHRFRVICAGRRFGKTILACWEMYAKAMATHDGRIAYIAPTYQQARDIAWSDIKKICEPLTVSVNESRLEITITNKYNSTSQISLRGWESVETMRGQKYDLLIIDEVAMMRNFWMGWNEVLSPTLIDRKGEAMFISTPRGYNHFYDLFNMYLKDTSYKSFHFTTYDNPHIPIEEINREKGTKPENTFAQEYMADFRKTDGLVYKEFSRERHIFTDLPIVQFIETIAGVDFGFNHPAAVSIIRKDYDGNYWMIQEWYKRGQTDAMIAEYVGSKRFNKTYPDPENAGGIQELRNHGVNVREVNKSAGSVKAGINIVRELLLSNRLHIHSSCVNTIQEFETYSYPQRKAGEQYDDENPLKENDDMMDSIRYALMMDTNNSSSIVPKMNIMKPRIYGSSRPNFNKMGNNGMM